jgi:hypothetical protein
MNNTLAKMIPLLARGIAPTAALASGLMSPLALGASATSIPPSPTWVASDRCPISPAQPVSSSH